METAGIFGIVTPHFRPDYLPTPHDSRGVLALAFYREALTVNSIPYSFLGFFKVINIGHERGPAQIDWITQTLGVLQSHEVKTRVQTLQRLGHSVGEYLYESGRCAVAHAYAQPLVNPEEPEDLDRLSKDLPVVRALAERFIEYELGIKSGHNVWREHLYELEGFRRLMGEPLLARIKSGEQLDASMLPPIPSIDLRLRDAPTFECFVNLRIVEATARDALLALECASPDGLASVGIGLNFAEERLLFDPQRSAIKDDGSEQAIRHVLAWFGFFKKYLGNGILQVWDHDRDELLGRCDPFIPENISHTRTYEKIDQECTMLEQELQRRRENRDTQSRPKAGGPPQSNP
jgi:hypothetical protein